LAGGTVDDYGGNVFHGRALFLDQVMLFADAAFATVAAPADLFAATAGFFSDRGLPGNLLVKLFHPSWRLRAGESFRRLDPEARAPEIAGSLPITIVQGDRDTRVKPSDALRLSAATGAPVVTVEGAAHKDVLARPETHREIARFIRSVGGRTAGGTAGDT